MTRVPQAEQTMMFYYQPHGLLLTPPVYCPRLLLRNWSWWVHSALGLMYYGSVEQRLIKLK